MTIPADPNTALSVDDAIKAFRSWTSAELLNNQYRWLVAESREPTTFQHYASGDRRIYRTAQGICRWRLLESRAQRLLAQLAVEFLHHAA
jgi:hypothetical protein